MAEAITILQSIKWATDTLWEFAMLVRRYQEVPERLMDLEQRLQVCEFSLQEWKTKWGVEERQPNLYYETLWSKRGWSKIRECLGQIDDIADLVKIKTNGVVGSAFKYSGGSRQKTYDGKFDKIIMRRALRRIRDSTPRRFRFEWAVLLRADDLAKQIERFNLKLIALESFARNFLIMTHPSLDRSEPSQLNDRAHNLIENKMKDKMKSMVCDAREDAQSLHRAYDLNDLTCDIALARGDDDRRLGRADSRLEPDFLFLFSNGPKLTELLVHPVQYEKGSNIGRLPSSMADAAFAKTISTRRPGDLLPPGAKDGAGFELKVSSRPSLTRLHALDPLSTLIGNSTFFLSAGDKSIIAASLIEESYRLLGTPWLGYLSTTNIRGSRRRNGAWTAMLRCQPGNTMITKTLAQFASQSANRTRDLSQHSQLFRLGIVLAELALDALVTYTEASDNIKLPGISLVIPAIADDERLDADEVAAAVEDRTGLTYANLVRYCLSTLQSRSKIRQVNLDDDYETVLLNPAREMAQLVAQSSTS